MKYLLFLFTSFLIGGLNAQEAPLSTASSNVFILEKSFEIPGLERSRGIRLYLPPSYENSDQVYPVIYMHDGQNLFDAATSFAGEWGVDEILDELSVQGGPEFIVVGIDNGGELRLEELTPYPHPKYGGGKGAQYVDFVVKVIKPYIDDHYRTRSDASNTAIIGSSLGGLISHYAIFKYPEVFSKAGVFSPSYWFSYDAIKDLTLSNPLPKGHRLNLLAGKKEGPNMYLTMQSMGEVIQASGVEPSDLFAKIVADGAHNEDFWRSEFKEALIWLFEEPK